MKAVIYARVSSREQEETGYSLPAQEKLLKDYAERKGFEVVKVFSISESASGRRQRQIFNEMLSFVKKNDIKIILCEKVDRLTRNLKDAVLIDEWLEKDAERQVHLVKDSLILHKNSRSQEKLNWGIRVILAKNYIENLSEEIEALKLVERPQNT
jgi:DNA invertase Pin-like site-specific DNA recombinase